MTQDIKKPVDQLSSKLRDYNLSQIGTYSKNEPLFIGYYADKEECIAGLYAYLSLGMFYIDLLWVDEFFRNQGLGTRLLNEAEAYALKREALYVRVNTGTFQAPNFYLNKGYEVFAQLPIKVEGRSDQFDYYLVKWLDLDFRS